MIEHKTEHGTRYVTAPAATIIGMTQHWIGDALSELSDDYPEFREVLRDYENFRELNSKPRPATLVQFAGQLCYLAFGKKRTPFGEGEKYLANILAQAHGSVLEHVNYTFLLRGIDRAATHELVRHRAGMAYSQVSQRYVGPEHLRYVCPIEDMVSQELLSQFEADIDANAAAYLRRIEQLTKEYPIAEKETVRDHRKRIQGAARSVLSNSVEAMIVVTGNARAWRHVCEMRCSPHADVRIRRVMLEVIKTLQEKSPEIFGDFVIEGGVAAPKYSKV